MKKFFICFIVLGVFGLSACDSNNETVHQYVVPLEISLEEKIVYVDNFINLTENSSLDVFEEGVPELLEQSLSKISDIILVPRHTVNKYLVSSNIAVTNSNFTKLAKKHGIQYLVNGWISKSAKGGYRFYANLMNVDSQEIQEKIAIISVTDREDALRKLNKFVIDITSKLSRTPEELTQLSEHKMYDYDLYQLSMNAYASAKRGRPYLAVNLLEKALKHIEDKQKTIMEPDEIRSMKYYSGSIRFDLVKLYTAQGKLEKAHEYLKQIIEYKDKYNPASQKLMDGLWAEHEGNYPKAKEIYSELINENPHSDYYHIRLADITLKEGKSLTEALAILEDGMDDITGNNAMLARRIARLQFQANGEKAFDKYADTKWVRGEDFRIADNSEIVYSMIDYQVRQQVVEANPVLKSLNIKLKNGNVVLDVSRLKTLIDLSCEETTSAIANLAGIAVTSGDLELAQEIAEVLKRNGHAENSNCAYHEISASVLIAQGKYKEAKKHALEITPDSPARFLVLGEIYQQQGNYKKAAIIMEKSLKRSKEVHPFVYYRISKAHELAGNYKKWNLYKTLFLKRSEELHLIPEKMRNSVKEITIIAERESRRTRVKVR